MKYPFTWAVLVLFTAFFATACGGTETSNDMNDQSVTGSETTQNAGAEATNTPETTSTPETSGKSILPADTRQAIVVVPAGWDDLQADFYLMEKDGKKWKKAVTTWAVLGKNGSAWGIGLHESPAGEKKKQEGDGRSPAGIFELGRCMGYAAAPSYTHSWPYEALTKDHIGVDDSESEYYNQVIDISKIQVGTGAIVFNSFETMLRKDDLYKWLFEVKHNSENKPNYGSLIFLHLWRAADKGTAGCTAVEESTMNTLLNWIDPAAHPVLILLPEETYKEKKRAWGLPGI